jgi:hypothetical protein
MATSKSDTEKDNSLPELPDQASKYIEGLDNEYMNKFRDLLEQYIETLPTDTSEIALGLNLSRTVVSAFMAGKRNDLPLSVGSICHLYKTLTDTERVKSKRISSQKLSPESNKSHSITKLRAEAITRRQELSKKGVDELLITAGFQPRKMKMVPVSPQMYSQVSFISYLYKDRPLSQDLFFKITEQELDRKESLMREQAQVMNEQTQNSKPKKTEIAIDIPLEELRSNTWMNKRDKDEIVRKYSKAINKINSDDLTSYEKAALLTSVLNNQLNKNEEVNFNLRVIRVERIPLSLSWEAWKAKDLNRLWNKITEISIKCENQLSGLPESNNKNYPTHQVTRTKVTCLCDEDESKIDFEFISTGTHSRTAISAIFLSLGLYSFIPTIKFDIKSFKEDVSSLIKALLIIKPNRTSSEESYLGEWVSSDLIQSIVQATVIASKKLVNQKIGCDSDAVDIYKASVKRISKIRKQFYKYRIAFDGYDFNDGIVDIKNFISIEKFIEHDCIKPINEIKSNYQNQDSVSIWDNFLSSFFRVRIGSKLYRLTHENIKFNHFSCKKLITEIDEDLSDTKKIIALDADKLLIPSRILLIAEKIAYNLSFAVSISYSEFPGEMLDLLRGDNTLDILNKIDKKIDEYLIEYVDQNKPYNDPGYDIHYSLGSYYSITGRVLLYRASNNDGIDSACHRLLKSIYYFYRIGLARKVERNLTLLGRVKVRAKNDDYTQQCKELSQNILKDNISKVNAPSNQNFEFSMESRLNSLSGEYSLILEDNKLAALQYALKALRGALWLGLNRHIADNLYTIARCAEKLENVRIQDELKRAFPQFLTTDRSNEMFVHSPGKNAIAVEVVSKLVSIYDNTKELEKSCWSNVWEDFRDESAKIWNTWHRNATRDKNAEHPFAIQIKNMNFLEPIE